MISITSHSVLSSAQDHPYVAAGAAGGIVAVGGLASASLAEPLLMPRLAVLGHRAGAAGSSVVIGACLLGASMRCASWLGDHKVANELAEERATLRELSDMAQEVQPRDASGGTVEP